MSKKITAEVSYSIPDEFDNAEEERSGEFTYDVIDSIADGVALLGEDEATSLLQKSIKIQSANRARVKLMSANGHLSAREMSEEAKAKLKTQSRKNRQALSILRGLSADKLEELGITI